MHIFVNCSKSSRYKDLTAGGLNLLTSIINRKMKRFRIEEKEYKEQNLDAKDKMGEAYKVKVE